MSETPETPEVPEYDAPELNESGAEDFDAFWRARDQSGKRKRKSTTIMGELVELPPSLPIWFELEAKRLQHSRDENDIRKLVGILFGEAALDKWAAAGMDGEQFAVLLAWAPLVIAGANITLAEVAASLTAASDAQDAGQDADPS